MTQRFPRRPIVGLLLERRLELPDAIPVLSSLEGQHPAVVVDARIVRIQAERAQLRAGRTAEELREPTMLNSDPPRHTRLRGLVNKAFTPRAVRALGKRWEAFGGLAWAKDPFAGFDSQAIASIGATYIAIESERHLLKFDGGLTHTWEDQISPVAPAPTVFTDSISFAGALLGLSWDWQLGKNSKLTERLVYLPNFDDSADWRLTSLTAIEAAVNEWLALRFGYDIRHRNQPIGNADKTDTTSTASVVFNF